MNKAGCISAAALVGFIFVATPHATAQLTEYKWNNPALVGAQSWQVNGNWDLVNFPNDPTTTDPNTAAIDNVTGASTNVALTGNLTLDVGATDVMIASLKLGGTAGAVTTNVSSSGGKIVFLNYDTNITTPAACAFNCGAALITSGGVAGSTNTISAPVQINNDRLEFSAASTNNVTLSGPVTFNSAASGNTSIRSMMPAGTKAVISGNVSLVDTATALGTLLVINDRGSAFSGGAIVANPSNGTLEISGKITDSSSGSSGQLAIGTTNAADALSTLILSGDNTYHGRTLLNRGNLVLASNSALGVDSSLGDDRNGGANFIQGNPSNQFGFNLLSDDDARTISVDMIISQWQTVRGNNSLTWAGIMAQNNARGFANLLPAGKTFTITNTTYASTVQAGDTSQDPRIFVYDGSGTTVVSGGWRNKIQGVTSAPSVAVIDNAHGHFRKTGTGTLLVTDTGNVSDFDGYVMIDQGVVRFANSGIFDQSAGVYSTGGAIGVDTGTFTNTTLLQALNRFVGGGIILNPISFPSPAVALNHGGLMLTAGEAAANIDFTIGDLAALPYMSVAPNQNGITYTGTITPAADPVSAVPTYRLGGGNATLTLPNNQLTGARNVQVTNGGEVVLNGANTYSGVTRIQAKNHTSVQNQAIANSTTGISNIVYEGTTLTVNTLKDGGLNSSIGSSPNAASNLVIQGSALKYAGAGANGTTNRLFTVGTGGATIDASGSAGSALNFTNIGALDMGLAGAQPGAFAGTSTGTSDGFTNAGSVATNTRVFLQNVDDVQVGMTLFGPAGSPFAAGIAINAIHQPTPLFPSFAVTIAASPATQFAGQTASGSFTFSGVARTLTLTGANTDANTLTPIIANAAATSGTNTVNVAKTGAGKWILAGNNTYLGTTTVSAGTLLINGNQSTATGATTVAAGATLGGTGTIGGAITNNGTIAPGASVGTLSALGNVTDGANSSWAIELSGTTADKLAVTGNIDLSAIDSLVVSGVGTGGTWIIGTYTGTQSGVFDSITTGYTVSYSGGNITLNSAGVPGDFNGNGTVDAADYVLWRKYNNTNHALANDGGLGTPIGGAHYTLWRNNFGKPPGSGASLGGGAVPEPSCVVLMSLALMVTIGGVRRRG